jgi:hypothetical protein
MLSREFNNMKIPEHKSGMMPPMLKTSAKDSPRNDSFVPHRKVFQKFRSHQGYDSAGIMDSKAMANTKLNRLCVQSKHKSINVAVNFLKKADTTGVKQTAKKLQFTCSQFKIKTQKCSTIP